MRACCGCDDVPCGLRPIIQAQAAARILIIGQAPGRRVHEAGIPWNDPSGERLRAWLGVYRATLPPSMVRIWPSFPWGSACPGSGPRGDPPLRRRCAALGSRACGPCFRRPGPHSWSAVTRKPTTSHPPMRVWRRRCARALIMARSGPCCTPPAATTSGSSVTPGSRGRSYRPCGTACASCCEPPSAWMIAPPRQTPSAS
ncbi:MAG: uracil-DNA glycosylase family protein [Acidiferrobacter sp.]